MDTTVNTAAPPVPGALCLQVPGGPHLNALKHGLRSAAVLLPGDDVAGFLALRRELFHTYQPRTRDEADCVESMAGYKWRIARCQRRQAVYEANWDAVLAGSPAGHVCEPDPHRWQHRSMDCVLEEQRLHKLLTKDRATVFELQRMRRNRLIDGAIVVTPSYLAFLEEGGAALPGDPPGAAEAAAPATPSADGQTGESRERNPTAAEARRWREAQAALTGFPDARDGARDGAKPRFRQSSIGGAPAG